MSYPTKRISPLYAYAVTLLAAASTLFAADPAKPPTTQSILQSAHQLRNEKKLDESAGVCENVIANAGATPVQKLEAFDILIDIARKQKNKQKALATAARIAAELPNVPEAQVRSAYKQAELLSELARNPEAVTHYLDAAKKTDNPKLRQSAFMRIAAIHTADNRPEEAIAAYERVFTESPTVSDAWFEAQKSIIALLRKIGRHEDALKAARICLDVSPDANTIAQNASLIAAIFKDIDKNVTRANSFLEFQQFGPAGKDATPNTGDDLADPLAAIPYPVYSEREKPFATARESAGHDAAASRFRALTYLYTGHPKDALQHLAEYFRRSHLEPYPMLAVVNEVIALGVRPVQGHALNLKRFYDFMRLGPPGPDGQSGTADDLKDPFAEIGLAARAPSDDGGIVPPPPPERTALIQLRSELEAIYAAEHDDHQLRMALLGALDRLHTSLCDWGIKGQTDWYISLFPDSLSNEYVCSTLLQGGEASARGSDLHFAGPAVFWKKIEVLLKEENRKLPEQPTQLIGRFQGTRSLLENPPALNPAIPLLK
jgi:tetratricopeptide (TPR) repeat protein